MKAYTNLEQSKKLAEILPLESADMRFCFSHTLGGRITGHYPMIGREPSLGTIPCWSLAALLDVLESEIDCKDGETYLLNIEKEGVWWNVWYRELYDEANPIETASTEELIDACVEMIIKLNKLNLL